jgi:hypothetical protein
MRSSNTRRAFSALSRLRRAVERQVIERFIECGPPAPHPDRFAYRLLLFQSER